MKKLDGIYIVPFMDGVRQKIDIIYKKEDFWILLSLISFKDIAGRISIETSK